MKKNYRKIIPIILAFSILTASYSHVYFQNSQNEIATLIKIKELKSNQLPDVTFVKKIIKVIAQLLPHH